MEQPLRYQVLRQNELICIPAHISRSFVQAHPQYNFVYASDIRRIRTEGQPSEFIGEPNAYPVPTLEKYCPSQKIYFNDNELIHLNIIEEWVSKIPLDKPIIPCLKIGRGCSQLYVIAPRLFSYLTKRIDNIKYNNIKYIYAAQ